MSLSKSKVGGTGVGWDPCHRNPSCVLVIAQWERANTRSQKEMEYFSLEYNRSLVLYLLLSDDFLSF